MDLLKKAVSASGDTEFIAIDATDAVKSVAERTQAHPAALIHLGQGLMGSLLIMSIANKEATGKLSLQWKVDGPFGDLYVDANELGQVRGTMTNLHPEVSDLNIKMGNGILVVSGKTKKGPTSGIVYSTGDVCSDILHYLLQSEQRQCAMNLWVGIKWNDENKEYPIEVKKAVGYLMELHPNKQTGIEQSRAQFWESRIKQLNRLSTWNLGENTTDDILKTLSGDAKITEFVNQSVSFYCPCSEERAERAMILVRKQDADEGKSEDTAPKILRCEFCGKTYNLI